MVTHPETIAGALALLADGARPVAGGTDWMLAPAPGQAVFFLDQVAGLRDVLPLPEGGVSIGAGVTFAALMADARVPPALREAAGAIASPSIRNMGTLGGNIVNASPAGDTLPVLYALGAAVELASASGARDLPIEEFIVGVKRTALRPDELLTRVTLPAFDGPQRFFKVGARRAQAISKCSLAAFFRVEDGRVVDFRATFGAVGPTVVRSADAESRIKGLTLAQAREAVPDVLRAYGEVIRPVDNQRSTAEYRRRVCLNLLEGFLGEALT